MQHWRPLAEAVDIISINTLQNFNNTYGFQYIAMCVKIRFAQCAPQFVNSF